MKRRALALCAGFLLLGLIPGSTMATVGNLDLSNPVDLTHQTNASSVDLAQTFTADKTGDLSRVDLYVGGGLATVAMNIKHVDASTGMPTGSPIESSTASTTTTPGWVQFSFAPAQGIFNGSKYAIVFNLVTDANAAYGSTGTAGGGLALWNNPSWVALPDPTEFAFRTFVDTVAPTLSWDKTTIQAETSTTLTLTETMTFLNGAEASVYEADLDAKPGWFTPTGITCSAAITNCTLGNYESTGVVAPAAFGGETLTIVLTGTALPHNADVGIAGVATTFACLEYPLKMTLVQPNAIDPGCPSISASIGVGVPAPTTPPTPPPTSTAGAPASDGSGSAIWFLPVGLLAAFGGLFVGTKRRRRIA